MKIFSRSLVRLVALLFAALTTQVLAESIYTEPRVVTTVAGVSSVGAADGVGGAARFCGVTGIVTDRNGNIYVADSGNHTIRKIAPDGTVSTLAGSPGRSGNTDGTGSAARFKFPQGLAVDASGNILVSDGGNKTIRKITPAGVVSTLTKDTGGAVTFSNPEGIAVDTAGNVYVADSVDHTVYKITSAGVVSTVLHQDPFTPPPVAGRGQPPSLRPFPRSVAVDAAGNVYAETNLSLSIVKVTPSGSVSEFSGVSTSQGPIDGPASTARFVSIQHFSADTSGNLLVTDASRIRKVAADGSVATLLGNSDSLLGPAGYADGPLAQAKIGGDTTLASDANGNLCLADNENNVVRKMTATTMSTLAGLALPAATGSADGTGSAARFNTRGRNFGQSACSFDSAGNLYLSDTGNNTIRKITPAGVVTTLAGDPANPAGFADGTGNAARFNAPSGIAVDALGNVFVADSGNNSIRKVTPAGVVTTIAGAASDGATDGQGTAARFSTPTGLALDRAGNIFVADTLNRRIRKIAPDGTVSTLAKNADGAAAQFFLPLGLAAAANGDVYVADAGFRNVSKIAPDGAVTAIAGTGRDGSDDGPGANASFLFPQGIAIDANGNLFVADTNNETIRQIAPDGTVSTVAGLTDAVGGADGLGDAARFDHPTGVAIDPAGALYVTSNTTIRKLQLPAAPVITTQPQNAGFVPGSSSPATFTFAASGNPAPTFQWFLNGTAISGATGATLTIPNPGTAQAGEYTVVASNSIGSVTSNAVHLFRLDPPQPSPTGAGSGGGGAPSEWFLLALLTLVGVRRITRICADAK